MLTRMQEEKLAEDDWVVFTNDSITQQAIAEYVASKANGEVSRGSIFYDGKAVPVFIIGFEAVLFLAKNRHAAPYDFLAYHRLKNKKVPWVIWREGKKPGGYILRQAFKKPKSEASKKPVAKKKEQLPQPRISY